MIYQFLLSQGIEQIIGRRRGGGTRGGRQTNRSNRRPTQVNIVSLFIIQFTWTAERVAAVKPTDPIADQLR